MQRQYRDLYTVERTCGQYEVQDSVRRNGQGRRRHDVEGGLSLGFYHGAELAASSHGDANRNRHSYRDIHCNRDRYVDGFSDFDGDRHSDGDCHRDADRYAHGHVNFNCN